MVCEKEGKRWEIRKVEEKTAAEENEKKGRKDR